MTDLSRYRRAARRATTLVEVMMVFILGTLILLPVIRFIVSSGKSATKGFEKLEALDSARFITERVQRDLKALCSGASNGFVPVSASPTFSFSFPIFPSGSSTKEPPENENPVNLVTYVFDSGKKTLTRIVKFHSLLAEPSQSISSHIIGKNVASFSILAREFLGMRFYDVEVTCRPGASSKKENQVFLRTAVLSEFETRLKRHPFQVNNRLPKISFPTD